MEDLELLKEYWNKPSKNLKEFSEKDLFMMIKSKSTNIARNLFLFGCLEMLIWFSYEFFRAGNIPYMKLILFSLLSVALFYQYFKIKNEDSTKQLMRNILEIRWIILVYVFINIALLTGDYLLNITGYTQEFLAGYKEGEANLPMHTVKPSSLNPSSADYIMFVVLFVTSIGLLLFIYKKVYGKLLKKLKANYNELSKVEQNTK